MTVSPAIPNCVSAVCATTMVITGRISAS